tara:strand:- start:3192 stop:3329 length:138 start_codon:yes stop_codon:yes gene_type:complete
MTNTLTEQELARMRVIIKTMLKRHENGIHPSSDTEQLKSILSKLS